MNEHEKSRRDFLKLMGAIAVASQFQGMLSEAVAADVVDIDSMDRVFIANEDSNTISVIDPNSNTVETTINLTSFDEDPRPPFRFVTGGVMPYSYGNDS